MRSPASGSELRWPRPARLAEEYYKILRSGAAERTFRDLHRVGLLEPLSEVLQAHAGGALWASLARLDAYRLRAEAPSAALTSGVLLGSLIVPLGFSRPGGRRGWRTRADPASTWACCRWRVGTSSGFTRC